MENVFLELVGKPKVNPPKIITIVAENFSISEYQARFLKATIAIPNVKQLPLDGNFRLVQIGKLHHEIRQQAEKFKWHLHEYEELTENICDRMAEDLLVIRDRSLIFINDVSRFELAASDPDEPKKLLALVDKLKRTRGHFVALIYQNSKPQSRSKFLRNIEYMSDGFVRASTCKVGYFMSIWFETIPATKTLIPPKTVTFYYTCKIGKSYWSEDLLCFYDKKQVPKNYNLETDSFIISEEGEPDNNEPNQRDNLDTMNRSSSDDEDEHSGDRDQTTTLPYIQAANPERSRIFFYPDKEDDLDEDDPDNDLGI